MGARQGGSYVADPKTGEEKLQERTTAPELHRVEKAAEPAPEVPTAPAAPVAPEPAKPAAAKSKPKE